MSNYYEKYIKYKGKYLTLKNQKDNGAFSHNKLTSVIIPDSVTTIDEGVFSHNKLTSVIIPDSVTKINIWAFKGNQLTKVTIPKSVNDIPYDAFDSHVEIVRKGWFW